MSLAPFVHNSDKWTCWAQRILHGNETEIASQPNDAGKLEICEHASFEMIFQTIHITRKRLRKSEMRRIIINFRLTEIYANELKAPQNNAISCIIRKLNYNIDSFHRIVENFNNWRNNVIEMQKICDIEDRKNRFNFFPD